VEIGAVDRESCRGTRTGACAELIREFAAVTGPLRSTELIYCWDPDGPTDPRGFARADHCDRIHCTAARSDGSNANRERRERASAPDDSPASRTARVFL
jgi:hypothetical protein